MKENKQVIHRKDGITYLRRGRCRFYEKKINLKIGTDIYDKLMEIAQKKQTTFSKLLREILEEYVNVEEFLDGENNNE